MRSPDRSWLWVFGLGSLLLLVTVACGVGALPARLPDAPLLSLAQRTMAEFAQTGAVAPALVVSLKEYRWVEACYWSPDRGPIVVGVSPSLTLRSWLTFGVLEGNALRRLGRSPVAPFDTLSCWSRIFEPEGELWAVFLDPAKRYVAGVIDVYASQEQVVQRPGPAPKLAGVPVSIGLDPARLLEVACRRGSLVVYDGALPDDLWVVYVRAPEVHAREGAFECVLPTVSPPKPTRGFPPADVSLFRIHPDGRAADVVLTAEPASEWPEGAPQPGFQGLDGPTLAKDGSRAAYRENAQWRSPDSREEMQLLRLWALDRSTGEQRLIDQITFYDGPAGRLLVSAGPRGEVVEQPWEADVWGEFGQLRPALSPDGNRVAYQRGEELYIRDVPQT
jgi:hypothetical protein